MKKICFLVCSPFSEIDYIQFGISQIEKLGFQILILDCTPFLESKFYSEIGGNSITIKNELVLKCFSKKDIFLHLNKFNPEWCIDHLQGFSKKRYMDRVHIRLFLKFNFKIIEYKLKSIPFYKGLIHRNFFSHARNFVKLFAIKILSLPWKIADADMVIVGGRIEYKKLSNHRRIIKAHNFDFDNFIISSQKKRIIESKKKLLFLDEDFPCHSDYIRDGLSPSINVEKYFEEISNCLLFLSNRFRLQPLIKLHPKANFKRSSKLYSIPVSLKDTAYLVSNADVVVAHCSTSIQLAVLFKKPLVLIIPNKLERNSVWRKSIDNFSCLLGVPAIKSSEINALKKIPSVNIESYNDYREKYIKMKGSPDKFSWEIITDNL